MPNLNLTDEQLAIVSKACELLCRIHLGQLEEVAWLFPTLPEDRYQQLTETLKSLNTLITELPPSAHFAIRNEKVPDAARCAYDIHQAIRHYLAWKQNPQGGHGVNFDSPILYSNLAAPTINESINES